MKKFNRGRPYHGSEAISHGKLRGATDNTDYFYFFCPKCPNQEILRVLDYGVHEEEPINPYDGQLKSKVDNGFTLAFKLYCENCGLDDYVKVSNLGWQRGSYGQIG